MPKLKTHKGAQARFHVTGTGKIMRSKGHKSHLRRKKPASVKRAFDGKLPISGNDRARFVSLLPYGLPK